MDLSRSKSSISPKAPRRSPRAACSTCAKLLLEPVIRLVPNRFYDPGEQRGAKVSQLFARIATRYDLLNDIQTLGWHRVWKRKLISLAQPRPGQKALDIC